jgi:6-phosphogluconolactonase
VKRLLLLLVSTLLSSAALAAPIRFYVGTYTDHSASHGIYTGTLDPATGKLSPLTLAAEAPDPNFLALSPDGRFLYAALGPAKNDAVAAYAIRPEGTLREIDRQPAQGSGICYVSLDKTGRFAFIANYSSGNIACFRLGADGSVVGPATDTAVFHGSGPNPKRQARAYAHSIYASPDNAFIYACDLGSDRVWIFRFDAGTGKLTPADPPSVALSPGSGPRHLAFGPDGLRVYVANELDVTVSVFARDAATGALQLIETASALPPGVSLTDKITSAEIAVHPSGRWAYVSVRGCETIAVFALDPAGKIAQIQSAPAGVKMPRHFAIDPTGRWLIAEGQADHRLVVLSLDPATGLLGAPGQVEAIGSPVCVVFARPSP